MENSFPSQTAEVGLDDLGLPAALRWMAEERLKDTGIRVELQVPDLPIRLPAETELTLYRVAQEALSNAMRHSGASSLRLSFTLQDRKATLEVEDNGKGFDVAHVLGAQRVGEGWGLLGMKERVTVLGGTLHLRSHPGRGTLVSVTVPF